MEPASATATSKLSMQSGSADYLKFAKDSEVVNQFMNPQQEVLLMSSLVSKWNKYTWQQGRNFVITNTNLYNFKAKKLRRVIRLVDLAGLTKNIQQGSKEFVIHVHNEPDYRIACEHRDQFFHTVKVAYISLKKNNLKIYGIGRFKALTEFVTSERDVKKGVNRRPLALARLPGEDLMSDEEVEKALTAKKEEKAEQKFGKGTQPNSVDLMASDSDLDRSGNIGLAPGDEMSHNLEHVSQAGRRKSSVRRHNQKDETEFGAGATKGETLYSIEGGEDMSQYVFEDYQIVRRIGQGTFGKVYLVENTKNKVKYAMKSIRKDVIIENDAAESLRVEKLILLQVRHPFIISMEQVFAQEARIYFVMKFMQGGELFKHLSEKKRFKESLVKFYAAQIALALGYLHKSNIYYRDLKPENILLGLDGYILLADFGLAKINQLEDGSMPNSFCGTPEYISPEMIVGSGHDHTLDWWALGVLIYEMIVGLPPFYHKNQPSMYQLIQQAPLRWPDPVRHKISVSDEAKDLISKLLIKSRKDRLGQKRDAEEVLEHPFFAGIDMKALLARQIVPEFVPTIDKSGLNNFDEEITNTDAGESIVPPEKLEKIKENKDLDNF